MKISPSSALFLVLLVPFFCACGTTANVVLPTSQPVTATPTPLPTSNVSFEVAVTPQPTRPGPTATPRPTATPIRVTGPALVLVPASGAPTSRTITIVGLNLPRNTPIDLAWSVNGRTPTFSTTTYTDRHGRFRTPFSIPGSPPGTYFILADSNGVRYAAARYQVHSAATLTVEVTPDGSGRLVHIAGRHFVPNSKFVLAAYPAYKGAKPLVIGEARSNTRGAFDLYRVSYRIVPGEYDLRAFSTDVMSAQMAQTLFQVVM